MMVSGFLLESRELEHIASYITRDRFYLLTKEGVSVGLYDLDNTFGNTTRLMGIKAPLVIQGMPESIELGKLALERILNCTLEEVK